MATNFTYTTNIPLSTNKPSVDQPNMQTNTNSISSIIAVDHNGFGTATGTQSDGWHTVIHSVPQAIDPPAVLGFGQIYTRTVTGDQQLFYESGGGVISQLTPGGIPVVSANGYTYLAGGVILQWGNYPAPGGGGNFSSGSTTNNTPGQAAITLPRSFPNNLFFVGGNLLYTTSNLPSGTGTLNVRASQLNSGAITTLSWQVFCNTNNYIGFDWIAIGN